MSKRNFDTIEPVATKRQKLNHSEAYKNGIVPIHSAKQLRELLAFHQDAAGVLRNGLKSFKAFLEAIDFAEDKTSTYKQQQILKEFLESQHVQDDSTRTPVTLPQLMQAWSFASNANNDSLVSWLTTVFARLLRTISTLIDFREEGNLICKTVLGDSQLKLIARALSSPKHKEHVISPSLRLLTEITSYDGGSLARQVFMAKASTFDGKVLSRNLSLWKSLSGISDDSKPTVRSNTLRYLLANLKYQSTVDRIEILRYNNIFRSFFEHIHTDPPELARESLDTFKQFVLLDAKIPRASKSRVLNDQTLSSLANLPHKPIPLEGNAEAASNGTISITEAFLQFIISSPKAGLLKEQNGWYMRGPERDEVVGAQADQTTDLYPTLHSTGSYGSRSANQLAVRNTALAAFAQKLKPFSSATDVALLINIFQAAPEIVAHYFSKSVFAFDPKLTTTWVGYASFLHATVQLPIPMSFGRSDEHAEDPPAIQLAVESILPRPLDRKILTRCLNQQHDLITFFAARILVLSVLKAQTLISVFHNRTRGDRRPWLEAAANLREEMTARCPLIKDVITAFRRTDRKLSLQRQQLLKLLSLYYEVLPQAAIEEKFDFAVTFAEALSISMNRNDPSDPIQMPEDQTVGESQDSSVTRISTNRFVDGTANALEIEHFLAIACHIPEMRWWQKPDNMDLSPFATLLKFTIRLDSASALFRQAKELMHTILLASNIVQKETKLPAVDALLESFVLLATSGKALPSSDAIFNFIENAFLRLSKKQVKYLDDLEELQGKNFASSNVSLSHVAFLEQWPFTLSDTASAKEIAHWLCMYMKASWAIGEDREFLVHIVWQRMAKATTDESIRIIFDDTAEQVSDSHVNLASTSGLVHTDPEIKVSAGKSTKIWTEYELPVEDERHLGLHRWRSDLDIQTVVSEGSLAQLVACLSSEYSEVRAQALLGLQQLMPLTETASGSWRDAAQIYNALGVLTATAHAYFHYNPESPLPFSCTGFMLSIIPILTDPLHPLYDRICAFNLRQPRWNIPSIAKYWLEHILYKPPPDYDTATAHTSTLPTISSLTLTDPNLPKILPQPSKLSPHHAAVHWLLSYIYASLRSPEDLSYFRRHNLFQALNSMSLNPSSPAWSQGLILSIIARATSIPDGSTTLITRTGAITYLASHISKAAAEVSERARTHVRTRKHAAVEEDAKSLTSIMGMKALVTRIWETSDQRRVMQWSSGTMEERVREIVQCGEE